MLDIYFTEIIRNYQFHSTKMRELIEDNETKIDEKSYSDANNHLNHLDATIEYIFDSYKNIESVQYIYDIQNDSLKRLAKWHQTKRLFDKEQARKTFINGLILIIIDEYTFDGSIFKNKQKQIHINNITK